MTSHASSLVRQELRAADGRVVAYFVPAEEMDRIRAEVESLREQLARAERQRDHYGAELDRILESWIPMHPGEAEMEAALRQPVAGSNELSVLIAELEARQEQP